MSYKHNGRRTLPARVEQAEHDYIGNRRKALKNADAKSDSSATSPKKKTRSRKSQKPSETLVGIALSGGGIRSATFSLGILQELARRRILPLVDYMCTVSGGGYIGSCLSSLLTRNTDSNDDTWQSKKDFNTQDNFPFHDADQVHHLRKHGDFLILRKGLIRRDVLRAIGTVLIGLICTIGLFVVFMSSVACLFLACTKRLSGIDLWNDKILQSLWAHFPAIVGDQIQWSTYGLLACTGAAAAFIPCFILLIRTILGRKADAVEGLANGSTGETRGERRQRLALWAFFIFVFVLCAVFVSPHTLGMWAGTQESEAVPEPWVTAIPSLLQPLAYSAGALLAIFLFYSLVAVRSSGLWKNTHRSLLGAMQGICLYCTVASILIPALVLAIVALHDTSEGCLPVTGLALVAARVFAKHKPKNIGADAEMWRKAVAVAPRAVLGLAVVLLIATVFLLCCAACIEYNITTWTWGLFIFGLFLALGSILDFNRISPHYFYRDRLADAYLRTEAQVDDELRIVRDDYSLKIKDLHNGAEGAHGAAARNSSPYHLVLCSLNLPGSRDLARKDRRSDHFIFSQRYCGSSTTDYVPTLDYRHGMTKLCTAMTISGAAASSMMGFYTSFGQAFAMTLFNIRLGLWLVNPRRCFEGGDLSSRLQPDTNPKSGTPDHTRKTIRRKEGFVFWPLYLYREFMASGNAQHRLVNLSDGGHTGDNLGLYPLLQRRCRLIIACDGEADPNYHFGSLTAAMRQIFTDENVIVDFKLTQFMRDGSGNEPQMHYVIGRVQYPDCTNGDTRETSGASEGWIICLKSSLLKKNEPATVIGYASKNKDFPHQSTADQFFDDDQFEAYRALGEHIARTMLNDSESVAAAKVGTQSESAVNAMIEWCRSEFKDEAAIEPPKTGEVK